MEKENSDSNGYLHSGLVTSILDTLSNWVLYTNKQQLGVTTTIHVTYVLENCLNHLSI